jgi:hypothetical protein
VSNTRRATGVPPAFAKSVPPSQDVAEAGLADLIGASAALHLGQLLAQLLPQMPWQPDCFFCLLAAKKLVHDHQVAVANASAAGEDMPQLPPAPAVNRAVTQTVVTHLVQTPAGMLPASGSVWACWDHLEVPSEPPRQTGLVGPDGRAIIARK